MNVQQFLGFANFYRRFIRGYSSIRRPLTQLTKKGQVWNWTNECQEAFNKLKVSFTKAPILTHYHPKKPLMIETDASDLAKGAVLSQYEDLDKKWHPVAFYSKKFSPAELNYDIHDKEMVVIVDCSPTTTSTDLIFAIFPRYQPQFSDFGTEAGLHGTSFSSEISWCPRILGIYALHRVIHLLLLRTVLILFPGEYLPLSGAEISIRTGVVARTRC